ncbi:unnamed protein product, partial [Meganyctiphanes norvegica]
MMKVLLVNILLLAVPCVHRGSAQLSFEEKYAIWASDLRPGFIIQVSQLDGRRCYCKVPDNNNTRPPTTFPPPSRAPTTVTPNDGCDPSCNVTYVIGPSQVGTTLSWSSLGWTEGNNYPP